MENLSYTQAQALTLLASGYNKKEVCKKVSVTESTLERWMKYPEYRKLLANAMMTCYNAALAELIEGSRIAAIKLKEIILDDAIPAKTKIQAINVLLTHAGKARDLMIEERLERIENILENESQTTIN
jgi:hypothetical protein